MSPEAKRALLFGSVATVIVSLLSLFGACVIPFLTGKARHRCMHFFVAMAVSTLSSDAILHIIPQINKDETNEHHDVGLWTLNRERWMLLRLSAIMLTIYFIYFIEFVTYYRRKEERWRSVSTFEAAKSKIVQCTETLTNHAWKEQNSSGDLSNEELNSSDAEDDSEEASKKDAVFWCGLKARALVILLGDGVHNLIDGIAIGASFHHSLHLGINTTIAVIFHEVPHELGDLAVLIESGLTMRQALFLNLLSAMPAFVGLFMSIIIGETKEVQMWLLAITAGMFIYVAWIDMLAHLKHDGSHKDHWVLACIIQYSGFTMGFIMLFTLGWFEQNIFS